MSTQISNNNVNEEAPLLQGQAEVFNLLFGYVDSMAVRSAVELRIADIIQSYGKPTSLTDIASKIESPSPDVACLARVMQVLVRKKLFTVDYNSLEEPLYGLTPTSKWLLHDNKLSLAPMFLMLTDPIFMSPWHEISRSIKEGGTPFEKTHGQTFWEKGLKEPGFNNMFNTGMASITRSELDAILAGYKDGFSKLEGSLVDVGGGIGRAVAAIVKAHPHIKGFNFDLPHVVATAPQHPGVTHVGGDVFKEIPTTDTVFIKSVLHDWSDEDCIKILKNCQKAVSEKKGKVIIVDIVLQPEGNGVFDNTGLACDLLMMAVAVRGKERTEKEWKKLLKEAGFARYNIIPIQALQSIIEAFPQ